MKRWFFYGAALLLAAVLGWLPFTGTDVAKLQPVEVLRVGMEKGLVQVETDTGSIGKGTDLEKAFLDLKETATGEIFLETADYLLLRPEARGLLEALADYLRPACGICLESGTAKLEQVAPFLAAHEPGLTLQEYRAGQRELPTLNTHEGRLSLVS